MPYLDHRVVEFAFGLPDALKVRHRQGKIFLKRWAERRLPSEHLWRRKRGFYVPVSRWLQGRLLDELAARLPEHPAIQRWFRPAGVTAMLRAHQAGANATREIWELMQLAIWHRIFVDGHVPGRDEDLLEWIAWTWGAPAPPAPRGARGLASGPPRTRSLEVPSPRSAQRRCVSDGASAERRARAPMRPREESSMASAMAPGCSRGRKWPAPGRRGARFRRGTAPGGAPSGPAGPRCRRRPPGSRSAPRSAGARRAGARWRRSGGRRGRCRGGGGRSESRRRRSRDCRTTARCARRSPRRSASSATSRARAGGRSRGGSGRGPRARARC